MVTFVFGGLVADGGTAPLDAFVFAGSTTAIGGEIRDGVEPSEPGEFAATPAFVEMTGAALGDRFTLLTISGEQAAELGFDVPEPDGPVLPATLVGIVEPFATELADATPVTVFPAALLDEGDIGVAASPAIADLAPGASEEDVRAQLNALEGGDTFSIESAAVVAEEVQVAVAAQAQAVGVLAGDRRPRGPRGPHPDAEPPGPLDGRRGPGAPGGRPGPAAAAARARRPGAGAGCGGHGRRGDPGHPAVRHLPDRVRAQRSSPSLAFGSTRSCT